MPERRVVAHDVPQDRPVADPDHRLRGALGLLAHPHAEASAEDDDLHAAPVVGCTEAESRSESHDSPLNRSSCSARRPSANLPVGHVDVVVGQHCVLGDVAPQRAPDG